MNDDSARVCGTCGTRLVELEGATTCLKCDARPSPPPVALSVLDGYGNGVPLQCLREGCGWTGEAVESRCPKCGAETAPWLGGWD